MKITIEKLSVMSLDELETTGEMLSNTNIDDAFFLYRFWLEKELISPSDDSLESGKQEISADLDRDYTYLLFKNRRYDELLDYYKKTHKINSFQGLEGVSRMIKDKDEAIIFIEKALLVCPPSDYYHQLIQSNLEELKYPTPRKALLIDEIDRQKAFDFISFECGQSYYPDIADYFPKNALALNEIEISLGKSRYGGPIVDLPKGIAYPEGLSFVASLDLSEFSSLDLYGLLPSKGQLYFFWCPHEAKQKTIYSDIPNKELIRIEKAEDDRFCIGYTIENFQKAKEKFSDRYRIDDEYEVEEQDGNTEWTYNNLVWDSFAGSKTSKVFGLFTHCQYDPNDIAEKAYSDDLLLIQIGENGFNDEGVLTVMINKEDLQHLNFSNCIYEWGQT